MLDDHGELVAARGRTACDVVSDAFELAGRVGHGVARALDRVTDRDLVTLPFDLGGEADRCNVVERPVFPALGETAVAIQAKSHGYGFARPLVTLDVVGTGIRLGGRSFLHRDSNQSNGRQVGRCETGMPKRSRLNWLVTRLSLGWGPSEMRSAPRRGAGDCG